MAENEGGESKSVGAFLLGFLTGVLVCLGAGGAFFVVQSRISMERARRAEMEAREAEDRAMMERERAVIEARRAEKALEDAKKLKEKKEK
jgi:hypothetical protein